MKDSLAVIYGDFKDVRFGMDTITHKYQSTYFDMNVSKPFFKNIIYQFADITSEILLERQSSRIERFFGTSCADDGVCHSGSLL